MIKTYIETAPIEIQPILIELYTFMKQNLPDATEKISYGMPTFFQKKNVIHFAYFKEHIGIFPGSEGMVFLEPYLKDYAHSKGGFQVKYTQKMPYDLIQKVIQFRLQLLKKSSL